MAPRQIHGIVPPRTRWRGYPTPRGAGRLSPEKQTWPDRSIPKARELIVAKHDACVAGNLNTSGQLPSTRQTYYPGFLLEVAICRVTFKGDLVS